MPEHATWIDRLVADGLLRHDAAALRTTRRWQGAMARAALRLVEAGEDGEDLRVPIAAALIELYGEALDDRAIVELIGVLLPIEAAELAPAHVP